MAFRISLEAFSPSQIPFFVSLFTALIYLIPEGNESCASELRPSFLIKIWALVNLLHAAFLCTSASRAEWPSGVKNFSGH